MLIQHMKVTTVCAFWWLFNEALKYPDKTDTCLLSNQQVSNTDTSGGEDSGQ